MRAKRSFKWIQALLVCLLILGGAAALLSAQDGSPNNSRNTTYYRQAYDRGFAAGQADFNARRQYSYHAALVAEGISAVSSDYRSAFKAGYEDGFNGRRGGSDYYYRRHRHESDCNEDDSRGQDQWGCREHHDNGKHKGWYKHHHHKDDEGDRDDR